MSINQINTNQVPHTWRHFYWMKNIICVVVWCIALTSITAFYLLMNTCNCKHTNFKIFMLIMIYLYNISRIILPLQMLCNRLVIYTYVNILNLGCCRDITFNVHTPLWTRSIKFEPLRKKDQSADTSTPSEIKKFLPYPSEKMQRSKDADAHNPSEMAFSTPLRNSGPLSVYIKWNGPNSSFQLD